MTTSLFLGSAAAAAEPSPAEMVDALNGVFGHHAGARASHAKGFCVAGSFTPTPEAQRFTQAKMFAEKSLPATVRFSIGGGNPAAPDKSRSVRGLAVRLSGGEIYDLVLISEPVFFASTPASFVSFLQARFPDPATHKPDPAKIAAHNQRFPESQRQLALLAGHAASASYAATPYYSNHAFRFVPRDSGATWARLVVEPVAGTRYLTADEEKALPDVFLEAELQARLAQGPVAFELFAQPQGSHDSLTDPAAAWSGGPARVALGRLALTHSAAPACAPEVFVPTNLPAGIEPADDPLLQIRAAAYQVSKARRAN